MMPSLPLAAVAVAAASSVGHTAPARGRAPQAPTTTVRLAAASSPGQAPSTPTQAVQAPTETARLAPGPHVDVATTYCYTCHSVDYITTQPRGMPRAFWAAEVRKMREAYGAPIPENQAELIVTYLTRTYSK